MHMIEVYYSEATSSPFKHWEFEAIRRTPVQPELWTSPEVPCVAQATHGCAAVREFLGSSVPKVKQLGTIPCQLFKET